MNGNVKNLYLLQDGTQADPSDCEVGNDGVLRHTNGLAVAMGENGEPQTIGGAAASGGNAAAAAAGKPPVKEPAKEADKELDPPAGEVKQTDPPANEFGQQQPLSSGEPA
ncbi:hypothetical protein ABH973_006709 [Bradyrhizobium ottawaense]|uniref:hypothetical protein n=1 Tax=Bradyrhizobium ottawaense TaxID=931866 RepID=UPI0035188FE6